MDYELYHDESKVEGYWHAILLVPVVKKQVLLQLLSQARQNTRYVEPLGIKNVKNYNRIYDCADCWIQIGVAALMSQTKTQPYPIFLGSNVGGQKDYSLFNTVVGAKFILLKYLDNLEEMTGHLDYGSKVETTFRIGLKGGLHLLGNRSEGIHITRMHFDGHAHYHRHLSNDRIIERLKGLRDYCSISTAAELNPTEPLPRDESYCDECCLCMASCVSGLMDKRQKTRVKLGSVEFEYSKRRPYLRCNYVCGGFTGLHSSGKWSTWSPGRFPIPEDDAEFGPALASSISAYSNRPETEGGYPHILLRGARLWQTCGNCQLVCHPDREERKRRYQMLTRSGVVVQHPDGTLEAMPPQKAASYLSAMDPEARALYEKIESKVKRPPKDRDPSLLR